MTTQIFVASTAFGLSTIAAGIADGAWPDADQRILIISNNATAPETVPGTLGSTGTDRLLGLFDRWYDYNDLIAPLHPTEWRPPELELPMLHRMLAERWEINTDDLRLIVESIQGAPALTMARIFPDAVIDVYADGLMSYGPTRVALPMQIGTRVDRLLHLDLVPGVAPLLLREWEVTPRIIPFDRFRKIIADLGVEPPKVVTSAPPRSVAVLLGQYLSATGILTIEEETDLHRELVAGAVEAGFNTLVFKPHPNAPDMLSYPLITEAERLGAELTVHDDADLVEAWFDQPSIGLVAGCFSTALLTAATGYQLTTARTGTELALEQVRPYENSNRIPVTLAHATLPDIRRINDGSIETANAVPTDDLVQLVGYCMQADRNPDLRPIAERLLSKHWDLVRPYVKRKRLTILNLPGRLPPTRKKPPKPPSRLRGVSRVLGPQVGKMIDRGRRTVVRNLSPNGKNPSYQNRR